MTVAPQTDPVSEPTASLTGSAHQFLSFTVDGRSYCVGIAEVREIRQWMRATPLPNQPRHVLGVLNLRGAIVPVQDLRIRLGARAAPPEETNVIVIVQQAERRIGLLVDSVSDILSLSREAIQPVPGLPGTGTAEALLSGLAVVEDAMVGVIDLTRVMDDCQADDVDA